MQSLRNKIDTLNVFLNRNKYQVACLSETWLSPEESEVINIQNFKMAAKYCRMHYKGGGVCIIVHNDLEYIERKDITSLSEEYVTELCAIEIKKMNLILICIYRPDRRIELFYQ